MYFKKTINSFPLIFLDSSKGVVSQEQICWLEKELENINQNSFIFIHHPPILADVPHMDINWPLNNHLQVQKILFKYSNHITVFCGHYHVEKTIEIKNVSTHITPSPFFNINQKTKEFKIDNYLIGYRKIHIKNNLISTSVVYI